MKMTKVNLCLFSLAMAAGLSSCNRDDELVSVPPAVANETELITTMQVHFTEVGMPSNTFTYEYSDVDGFGGNPPVADTIILDINKTYNVTIDVLNESETPTDTLTGEIDDEKNDHLFCFEVHGVGLTINRTDMDGNGLEVGLASDWMTGTTAGDGHMHITLKHQPGVKDGTCAPGETDIEADFEVKLQ